MATIRIEAFSSISCEEIRFPSHVLQTLSLHHQEMNDAMFCSLHHQEMNDATTHIYISQQRRYEYSMDIKDNDMSLCQSLMMEAETIGKSLILHLYMVDHLSKFN
jgi:hypothetical protein